MLCSVHHAPTYLYIRLPHWPLCIIITEKANLHAAEETLICVTFELTAFLLLKAFSDCQSSKKGTENFFSELLLVMLEENRMNGDIYLKQNATLLYKEKEVPEDWWSVPKGSVMFFSSLY